jgi:N-acyl-phosphatidylethanolamine-hydrolysing phospholipase D
MLQESLGFVARPKFIPDSESHALVGWLLDHLSSSSDLITSRRRLVGGHSWPSPKLDTTVPVRRPEFLPTRSTPKLRTTWLGHACYLIEFPGGLRVLFDPVFQDRCSPFSFFGPKRYTEIPCQIDDIPIVDAVVISHNHYDHLSHPTVLKIKERHPHAHFFVPLGNKKWFNDCNIHNVTEMDWWEERDLTLKSEAAPKEETSTSETIQARIGCLPCQHTSARTPFDKAKTLWSSWSVESGGQKVWFAG